VTVAPGPLCPLRPARAADVPTLAAIYGACARELGPRVYTPEQVAAWASFSDDVDGFGRYVLEADTWVAEASDGTLRGFSGFSGQAGADRRHWAEVHSLYVRPADIGRGLGTRLLQATMQRAAAAGLMQAEAWATPFSRPRFEQAGFVLADAVWAPYQGVMFERYRMVRR
jgi:putative acetyltransferase